MSSASGSVYSQDPSTTQTPMYPLNPSPDLDLTPTTDLASTQDHLSTPPATSTLNQAATTTLHLHLTPTQASEIVSRSLELNAALTDLSHQLHRVRWAIKPLRDAISLAVDPLGIHVDARENEM